MQERTKLGAAVVGGYILGRTKKGMAAARFAMWLSGSPQVMEGARTALSAPEIKQVADQLSGPLADAARKAALAAVLNRIGGLNNALVKRTEALSNTVSGTAEDVTDTAGKATEGVTGLLGNKGGVDEQEEPDTDEPDDEDGEDDEEHEEPSEGDEEEEEPEPVKQPRRTRRARKSTDE
jgi:hypothetical protein